MWPEVSVPKGILLCHELHQHHYAGTVLLTAANPERPQRVVLISIFIEMLSKPLRATHGNQCCLGSALQRQAFPAHASIVCRHAIHPHLSEETAMESHLCNSSLRGTVQLRLRADRLQCVLIDKGHILHMGEKHRNIVKGRERYVAHKACPAGFLYVCSNVNICRYQQFSLLLLRGGSLPEEDPLADWMMTVPVPKYTTHSPIPTICYTDSDKVIQWIINDKWKSNPRGDSIHGKRKHEYLVPVLHCQHRDWEIEICHDGLSFVFAAAKMSTSPAALIKGMEREWIFLLGLSGLRGDGWKNHEINNWQTQTCRLCHASSASAAARQEKPPPSASNRTASICISNMHSSQRTRINLLNNWTLKNRNFISCITQTRRELSHCQKMTWNIWLAFKVTSFSSIHPSIHPSVRKYMWSSKN